MLPLSPNNSWKFGKVRSSTCHSVSLHPNVGIEKFLVYDIFHLKNYAYAFPSRMFLSLLIPFWFLYSSQMWIISVMRKAYRMQKQILWFIHCYQIKYFVKFVSGFFFKQWMDYRNISVLLVILSLSSFLTPNQSLLWTWHFPSSDIIQNLSVLCNYNLYLNLENESW